MKTATIALPVPRARALRMLAATLLAAAGVFLAALDARASELPPLPAGLAPLVREAQENNQDILSARERAESLRARAPYAGSLPDPRLGVGLANVPTDSFELDQEAMTQKQIFAAQKVPWFGTLDLKEQDALLAALAQDKRVDARRLAVAKQVAMLWLDLGFAQESLRTNDEMAALVDQLLRVAESRYATGQGAQQDILAAQVRRSQLLDERTTLEQRSRTLSDRINALLNREAYAPIEPPRDIAPLDATPDAKRLARAALARNPLLAERAVALDKAKLGVALAEKDYFPDMDFKLAYGQRDDDPIKNTDRPDFVSGSVTFTIPLWQASRQDSGLRAAKRAQESARRSLEALRTSLPHEVDALVAQVESALANHKLFADAVAVQAAQWADAGQAAYETGKAGFGELLDARMRQIRFGLKARQYTYEAYKKLAELAELVGDME